jgi:hypothetical protein
MMKNMILSFLMSFFMLCPMHARIGESGSQCAHRYGSPLKTEVISGGYVCTHRFKDFELLITYQNAAAVVIIVSKYPSGPFTAGEVAEIFKANGGEDAERISSTDPTVYSMKTRDGKTVLSFMERSQTIVMANSQYMDQVNAQNHAQENQAAKDSTSGF